MKPRGVKVTIMQSDLNFGQLSLVGFKVTRRLITKLFWRNPLETHLRLTTQFCEEIGVLCIAYSLCICHAYLLVN